MTTLPPHLEALEADLGRAATRRVRALRRRRRVAQLSTATLLALGLSAGALAATGDLGRWLAPSDDPGKASFLIDRDRTYDGPTPERVSCVAEVTSIVCEAAADGARGRPFSLAMTIDRPPSFARDDLRRLLGEARERGDGDPALLDRIERNLETVPDAFFVNLGVLAQLGSFATSLSERGEAALVPPPGVPLVVACGEADGAVLACRALRGARGVPAGAPVYVQEPATDWVPAPSTTPTGPVDAGTVVDEVWGRPLQIDELQLLNDLSIAVVARDESTTASAGPPAAVRP
ncbi:MAG: hypothetical protein R3C15_09805 [Thermoleophilia bacterium]